MFLLAAAMFADGDPWSKVRELKSGADLRIYRKGAAQPTLAKMDELKPESLLVVIKNEQVAIPRAEIDRIDYRPVRPGGRVTKETRGTRNEPDKTPAAAIRPNAGRPTDSYSSSVGLVSKPDFETVYRRR